MNEDLSLGVFFELEIINKMTDTRRSIVETIINNASGAYSTNGIKQWLERPRLRLANKTPMQTILTGDDKQVAVVSELSEALIDMRAS